MSAFTLRNLHPQPKAADHVIFERWMTSVAVICDEFWAASEEFYPFHDNEISAVSVLLAGAARAGFSPVAEYRLKKRGRLDKRSKPDGRADLWFLAERKSYSFEFKRAWDASTLKNLGRAMRAAQSDVACIPKDEYDHAYAGLIAPVDETDAAIYEALALTVDFAFWIGIKGRSETFFFFERCQ